MSFRQSIDELVNTLEWLHIQDVANLRPELERLHDTLGRVLSKKPVSLVIKVVNGWDYVYANYDGKSEYLGKHLVNFDRRTEQENLLSPRVWDFVLHGRKLNEASFNRPEQVWSYTFSEEEMETYYGERLNGSLECPETVKYDRRAYEVAVARYQERYECLYSRVGKLAQIDRLAGIRKLEHLEESGYEIIPL